MQTVAEVLGGLVYAYQIRPDAKVMLGTWPMVLRSAHRRRHHRQRRAGAGVVGLVPDGAVLRNSQRKHFRYRGLEASDAQSGFEKGVQHALVGNSGGNVLFCAAGALAAGLGCSHAGVVIDNEIIGTALRTVAGFEVNEESMGRRHDPGGPA